MPTCEAGQEHPAGPRVRTCRRLSRLGDGMPLGGCELQRIRAPRWYAGGVQALPEGVAAYRSTACFDESTIPAGLTSVHTTRAGVWARIVVEHGRLLLRFLEPQIEEVMLDPDRPGIVAPGIRHQVEPVGVVRFRVEFLR